MEKNTAAKKMQELYEWQKAWDKYNTKEKRPTETDKSERRRVKVRK